MLVLVATSALFWADWPSLRGMISRWSSDPRYSHGFLVPAFAVYLAWSRRAMLASAPPRPSPLGLAWIIGGAFLGLIGARFYLAWFESLALLPSLAGICLIAWGRPALRWAWPSIAFLIFMLPLPYQVEVSLGAPLQRAATAASTYALQTIGLPAVAEGNIILIDDARIGVVEACNGLGMLLMFFAFASAIALAIRRSAIDRALIVFSAAPIAFLANVSRIAATGVLHRFAGGPAADSFYHDLAGWLMMPAAMIVFWMEMGLLSHLFTGPPAPGTLSNYASPGEPPIAAGSVTPPTSGPDYS